MTEEVTDVMIGEGVGAYLNALSDTPLTGRIRAAYLAMEAARVPASNSPTNYGVVPSNAQYETPGGDFDPNSPPTNGEVSPLAASDDEVGRIIEDLSDLKIASPVLGFMGQGRRPRLVHEIHELANEAAAALAALTTPTKASAVDDPKTAKGGE